jgi:hypothetical protein
MIFNVLIVAVSLLLLLYWFRYTCLLLLRTKPVRDYSKQVAAANQLRFVEVRGSLAMGEAVQPLDKLEQMLERDYRLVMYLMRHAANFRAGGSEIERRLLMLDFTIMKMVYRLSMHISPAQARHPLEEMTHIIAHFANAMGERAALATTHA